MRVAVLLNAKAGSVNASTVRQESERVRDALSAHGVEAEIHAVPATRLSATGRDLAGRGFDAIVAVGGDGTVSAVAEVLVGTQIPLGVLPLGTLNHFARDLGLPLDLDSAARVIAEGQVRAVDVGDANGRSFINNSSIGIYPQVVRDRDEQRQRLGRGKWIAMFVAIVNALKRFPVMRVRLGIDDRTVLRTTPFVFVGNNEYEMSLFNVGKRMRLDAGTLSLYVAHRTGRFGLIVLALRAILGKLSQAKDFEAAALKEFYVDSGKRHLHVAFDGEPQVMAPPIRYTVRPGALKVIAPRESGHS